MRTNKTKAKLKAGETVFGCFLRYADPTLVEIVGSYGWDFLVFDGEHSTIEPRDCENLVRAAENTDATPIVRVPTNHPATILRFMDTGPGGLHVPWVNSAAEAEQVVSSVKYKPRGNRGLAGVRAARFGQIPLGEYVVKANAETLVTIHIETVEAIEQLPEIVKIDGLDVIFIGPTDLSQSVGVPGQVQHPDVLAAIDRIINTVSGTDKAIGIMTTSVDTARHWQSRGVRYIAISFESLVRPATVDYLSKVRGGLS